MKNFIKLTIATSFAFNSLAYATEYNAPSVQQKAQPSLLSETSQQEERIPYLDVITKIPDTSMRFLKTSFSKESVPWWGLIVGSTLVLIHNDEVILRNFQRQGREWGIGNEDNTKAVLSAGSIDLLRLPTDTGSLMYFLGDGWMHFGIAGGFYLYGQKYNNNRAFNTSLRLVHGMATSTIYNQILKRSFGRESPYVRTEPFGKWRPFPSVATYQEKTSAYDAMPSGHVMTATLVFTIINDAYPEYSKYIVPTAGVWITLLGYQMVNNGVHWASDYPLGIAMGYVIGKASAQLGKDTSKMDTTDKLMTEIQPVVWNDYLGLNWTRSF